MNKIKVTQEQANVIRHLEENYTKGQIVKQHVMSVWRNAYDSLNKMNLDEVCLSLYEGYEVEPQYKVGDWVVANWQDAEKEAYLVESVSEYGIASIDNLEGNYYPSNEHLRHATPEEIAAEKNRRLWKSIGRGVGEFKIGDLYVDSEYTIYLVSDTEEVTYDQPGLLNASYGTVRQWHSEGNFKGLYPAESFTRFEDDSRFEEGE